MLIGNLEYRERHPADYNYAYYCELLNLYLKHPDPALHWSISAIGLGKDRNKARVEKICAFANNFPVRDVLLNSLSCMTKHEKTY